MPLIGRDFFNSRQVDSIVLVCAPVSGSTKFTEWLTFKCSNPSLSSMSYAFQQSLIIVVPGCMFDFIILAKCP